MNNVTQNSQSIQLYPPTQVFTDCRGKDWRKRPCQIAVLLVMFAVIMSPMASHQARAANTSQKSGATAKDVNRNVGIVADKNEGELPYALYHKRLQRLAEDARQLAGKIEKQIPMPAQLECEHVPAVLYKANRVLLPMLHFDANGGILTQADVESCKKARTKQTDNPKAYREAVLPDLPHPHASDVKKNIHRFNAHVANAAACLERLKECERRHMVSVERRDCKMAFKHLRRGLYMAWKGRQQMREAKICWMAEINALQREMKLTDEYLKSKNLTLEESITRWQNKVRSEGLPEKHMEALQKIGMSTKQIENYMQQMLSCDAKQTSQIFHRFLTETAGKAAAAEKTDSLDEQIWLGMFRIWSDSVKQWKKTQLYVKLGPFADIHSVCVAVPTGTSGDFLAQYEPLEALRSHPVMPGAYDIYFAKSRSHKPELLASKVVVKQGETIVVDCQGTEIQLTLVDWIEDRMKSMDWWGVVNSGQSPASGNFIYWTRKTDKLSLPAGKYDVYWKQRSGSDPVLAAKNVDGANGKLTEIRTGSAIRLSFSDWISNENALQDWWGVVKPGDPPHSDNFIYWIRHTDTLFLPPGKYDVYWQQKSVSRPLPVAMNIEVMDGKLHEICAGSGIHFPAADQSNEDNAERQWWGIVKPGNRPVDNNLLYWSRHVDTLLVQPGTYDIYQKVRGKSQPVLVAKSMVVAKGKPSAVNANRQP